MIYQPQHTNVKLSTTPPYQPNTNTQEKNTPTKSLRNVQITKKITPTHELQVAGKAPTANQSIQQSTFSSPRDSTQKDYTVRKNFCSKTFKIFFGQFYKSDKTKYL